MAVVNLWTGATTDTGVKVATHVDSGADVRLAVSPSQQLDSPTFFGPVTPDANDLAVVEATGLDADTRYWYGIEHGGTLDTVTTGSFLTHPVPAGQRASFKFWMATCARGDTVPGVGSTLVADGARLSNHPVFAEMHARSFDERWLFGIHGGDLHYYDLGSGLHGIAGGGSEDNFRRAYDDVLLQPNQHRLYRHTSTVYVWDDHDFGPNDSDSTFADKVNGASVYRQRVPHYALEEDSGAIYHSFEVGRVLFIVADVRYVRHPNDDEDDAGKTMLGQSQKSWMRRLLGSSTAEVLCWVMPDQWYITDTSDNNGDTWASFSTERDELAQMFVDFGWSHRMFGLSGDNHGIGIDSGAGNAWGGFPWYQFASLDASTEGVGHSLFDQGPVRRGAGKYGLIEIDDFGDTISVTGTAYSFGEPVYSYQFGVVTSQAGAVNPIVTETVSGSHEVVVEARILTEYQTGPDPDGEEIAVSAGDVYFDATADVYASMVMDTIGVDETTYRSIFPRRARDLLAPYGNEVFLRRGIDLGAQGVIWSNLGYFRLDNAEQDEDSDSLIRLVGQDRMSNIVDAKLLQPVQFFEDQSAGFVVDTLVREVLPDVVIVWDDNASAQPLGRQIFVEESRYDAIAEVADSRGKVLYFDGDGVLRIEDAPDPDTIVWEVKAGYRGVLIDTERVVSREGVYNAVVATGEGASGEDVFAVAVDVGAQSPTRFGGRFGRVPRFFNSPLLTTTAQAELAARTILQRSLGMPYSADFGAVVHPQIRPRMLVRVTQKDGNREKHHLERVTIPLEAQQAMTGTTREQTRAAIGSLAL